MASTGSAKQTPGFADVFGGKLYNTIDYSGPTSYNNTGTPATSGDTMHPRYFGFPNTIEFLWASTQDQSGVYVAIAQPLNNGVTKWVLRWYTASGMTEVANATDLHLKVVKLSAVGF